MYNNLSTAIKLTATTLHTNPVSFSREHYDGFSQSDENIDFSSSVLIMCRNCVDVRTWQAATNLQKLIANLPEA